MTEKIKQIFFGMPGRLSAAASRSPAPSGFGDLADGCGGGPPVAPQTRNAAKVPHLPAPATLRLGPTRALRQDQF